ncbi:hypothetical protein ELH49_25920 (plasmid) [Rhizobium ruizarguesonis]|uniref:hypothetical protein n=1 Tax=Rhizobium ruizarguesonis TaxID=2081791 RepID=UPI00047FF82D|nr:hypothetical protein [Rhizobium ruizarguesonis]QJS31920.1 hypothetical protein RLTA1_31890 [Rhizobium leguminosarum bv. trifolii TA1]TBB38761.1 hypothetical protein ELH49_25920 [Rhizobium ruizarguesonis]UFW98685.1 hypothetical protein RlegTA1_31840 [Rhizobium ruizarguesonis]
MKTADRAIRRGRPVAYCQPGCFRAGVIETFDIGGQRHLDLGKLAALFRQIAGKGKFTTRARPIGGKPATGLIQALALAIPPSPLLEAGR